MADRHHWRWLLLLLAGFALTYGGALLIPVPPPEKSLQQGWGEPRPEAVPPVSERFLWGVATAGFQWEGHDQHSNWTHFIKKGGNGRIRPQDNSVAVDGLHRYLEDIRLAKQLGCKAFRTSLEWSRIEPEKGKFSEEGLAFYAKVLRAIHAQGMTPVVTLLHFAYPQWLEAEGGWEGPKAVSYFERYVRVVAKRFGPDIRYYLTFNEPNAMLLAGYVSDYHAPGKRSNQAATLAMDNFLAAHNQAYHALHELDPDAQVSLNLYRSVFDPRNRPTPPRAYPEFLPPLDLVQEDAFVAKVHQKTGLVEGNRKPNITQDYLAFDYYTKIRPNHLVSEAPKDLLDAIAFWGRPVGLHQPDQWEVYPQGIYEILKQYDRVSKQFDLPILIAENGLATWDHHPRPDGYTRAAYLAQHTYQVQRAMREGVDVLGYIVWSITDNYEWGSTKPRFGLYGIDYSGRLRRVNRTDDEGVEAYTEIIANRGVSPAILAKYPPPDIPRGRL